jgi:hypothetical protein
MAISDRQWAQIELDYKAGLKTMVQLCRDADVTRATVYARAKRLGWTRGDPTPVMVEAIKQAALPEPEEPPRDDLDVAARQAAQVLRRHRSGTEQINRIIAATAELAINDPSISLDAVKLSNVIKALAVAASKAIPLERIAHGLDAGGADPNAPLAINISIKREGLHAGPMAHVEQGIDITNDIVDIEVQKH